MKTEDGEASVLMDTGLEHIEDGPYKHKYTERDIKNIKMVNEVLASKNMPTMTEEEELYLVDPTGTRFGPKKDIKAEELQRLAGFEVTKTIKYYDDLKDKSND
jgi:hypothetical protein